MWYPHCESAETRGRYCQLNGSQPERAPLWRKAQAEVVEATKKRYAVQAREPLLEDRVASAYYRTEPGSLYLCYLQLTFTRGRGGGRHVTSTVRRRPPRLPRRVGSGKLPLHSTQI